MSIARSVFGGCPPLSEISAARRNKRVIRYNRTGDGQKEINSGRAPVDEQMLAMLEWASSNPTKWHPIGRLKATIKAAELLAKRGVIEIWPETQLYRLKPVQRGK